MASKSSYQELSYQTYLEDQTGSYIPSTVDLRLGSIAELEKMRRIALANSDKEMMIEQITNTRTIVFDTSLFRKLSLPSAKRVLLMLSDEITNPFRLFLLSINEYCSQDRITID